MNFHIYIPVSTRPSLSWICHPTENLSGIVHIPISILTFTKYWVYNCYIHFDSQSWVVGFVKPLNTGNTWWNSLCGVFTVWNNYWDTKPVFVLYHLKQEDEGMWIFLCLKIISSHRDVMDKVSCLSHVLTSYFCMWTDCFIYLFIWFISRSSGRLYHSGRLQKMFCRWRNFQSWESPSNICNDTFLTEDHLCRVNLVANVIKIYFSTWKWSP